MSSLKYSYALDGLRTFSIIITIFHHIDGVPSIIVGIRGVDIFLPLSGFLITRSLLRSDYAHLVGYYTRRFYRLTPLYYFTFFSTVLLALVAHYLGVGESKMEQLKEMFLWGLFFSRELADLEVAPTLFVQSWTVGIQEKFFVTCPLVIIFFKNKRAMLLLVVALFCALIFYTLQNSQNPYLVRGYVGISFGVVAGIFFHSHRFFLNTNISFVILLLGFWACYNLNHQYRCLFISFSASLLIPSLYAEESWLRTFLSYKPIVFLGKLTYSIYMLHVLVLFLTTILLPYITLNHYYQSSLSIITFN